MANIGTGAVKLIDTDGDPMDTGGALKVQLVDSTDNIDIGNVDLMLDGGVPVLGNAGDVAAGVLRVTLAANDAHFGAVGGAADVDGTIHGQLRYIGNSQLAAGHTIDCNDSDVTVTNMISGFATSGNQLAAGHTIDCNSTFVKLKDGSGTSLVSNSGKLDVCLHSEDGTAINQTSNALDINIASGGFDGAVTNAGTFAVQISDTSFAVADGSALGEGVLVQGDDGSDRKNIHVDATTGDVKVDVTNTVTVDGSGVTQPVSGTFWQGTQPVSGTVTANLGTTDTGHLSEIEGAVETIESAIYVDDADWDGSSKHMLVGGLYGSNTITSGDVGPIALAADGAVHIDDGGNTITVDGTITANAGSGTLAVSLASVPSHAVTNAGTFAVQEDGDALTALQLIDNSIFVDNAGFTLTSSSVNVAGGVYQNGTPGTLGDNDAGAILLNSTSGQMVELMASTAAIGKVGHDITGIVSDRDVDVGTTAEKIHTASDVAIKRIDIQAAPANTGYIFVGDGGVAGDGTGGGIRLAAGDFYSLDIDNTGDVYVAASEANEDVYYTYYT